MILSIQSLRSGSSGNALLARGANTALLIDAGLTYDDLTAELASRGLGFSDLAGILLTHAHGDHTGCARTVSRREKVTLYMSAPAARGQPAFHKIKNLETFEPGATWTTGDLYVKTLPISHDSPGTVACFVGRGTQQFGIATDLGRTDAGLESALAECAGFLLEFNHDERLLRQGIYPWRLKRRVLGEEGHLSNDQAAAILARSLSPLTRHVLLGHLSDKNNRPELAMGCARGVLTRLGRADVVVEVAPRGQASNELRLAIS